MKSVFRLTLSILILAGCTGLAAAHVLDNEINIADFANCPEALEGRVVEVTGQVIAINADSKSIQLFDSQSRMLIGVRLTQLRKAGRTALISSGTRLVLVSGRVTLIEGRLVINAQRIEALSLYADANSQTTTETVPVVSAN